MVGSEQLAWPDDPRVVLGLQFLIVKKLADDPDYAIDFSHTYFYSGAKIDSGIRAMTSQLIIPFVRDYKSYILSFGRGKTPALPTSNKIFIVHGHDEAAREGLARFIEKLGLEAIILNEQPNQGRTVIEKFENAGSDVGFAVVLLTPDDVGNAATAASSVMRARQNVIFELGYFAGQLGRGRVCLLRKGSVEIPSDLFGVVYTEMDAAGGWKAGLARELRAAGIEFDASRALG